MARKKDPWGKTVLVDFDDGIAWVTLNRPEKRNAMSPKLNAEMQATVEALTIDPRCGVLVLTGAGDSFTAGMDLKEYFRETDGKRDMILKVRRTFKIMSGLPSVSRKYSLRSMPAANESPAPVSTKIPQRSSVASASTVSRISTLSFGLIALRLSGRFSVTHAMPSSNFTSTSLPQGSFLRAMRDLLKAPFYAA